MVLPLERMVVFGAGFVGMRERKREKTTNDKLYKIIFNSFLYINKLVIF